MLFLDLCCFYSNTVSNTYFAVMNFNKVTRLGFLGRRAAQWKLRYTVWSPAAGSSQWKPTVYVTSAGHLVKGLLSHMSSPHVCFNGSESHWPAMFIWSEREKDAGCFQHQFKRIIQANLNPTNILSLAEYTIFLKLASCCLQAMDYESEDNVHGSQGAEEYDALHRTLPGLKWRAAERHSLARLPAAILITNALATALHGRLKGMLWVQYKFRSIENVWGIMLITTEK